MLINSKAEFIQEWRGKVNGLFSPNLWRFDAEFPPVEEVVDILRKDEKAAIKAYGLDDEKEREEFVRCIREDKLESILDLPFLISHFSLSRFYEQGRFLWQFQEQAMNPWRAFLSGMGFTWQRLYPIIFISGKGCNSTYHTDVSHVLAWQIYGTKHFNSYKDPDLAVPLDDIIKTDIRNEITSPHAPKVDENNHLCHVMKPGDVLWNQIVTPHWVVAGDDEIAMSINVSHGGLCHQGRFSDREKSLLDWREKNNENTWLVEWRY